MGRHIPWPEVVSHFDNDAVGELMRQTANRLYTFLVKTEDPDFPAVMERRAPDARGWDVPKLGKEDKDFMKATEAPRASTNDGGTQLGPEFDAMNEPLCHC